MGSTRTRFATGAALIALAAGAQPAAAAQGAPQPRSSAPLVNLPLSFAGAYQGDIAARPSLDGGSVTVDLGRFVALLGKRLPTGAEATLRGAAAADGTVSSTAIEALGVHVAYDSATLEIAVTIPVAKQGAQAIAASDSAGREPAEATLQPEKFAATATLSSQQRYRWKTATSRAALEPLNVAADLAANVGGLGGVSLFGQFGWRGAARGLERGNVLLVHDDQSHAIRYSGGDIAPLITGFQTAPLIGGVAIERQFGTLQPFRNIRPSGQFGFVLEQPSTIDVVVNGATLRTLRLEAGQYNLRDFPFFNGLNQVELYVVDNSGRRLLASFSQYFSARLLDRKIFEFGASVGVLESPQQQGGVTGSASRYRTRDPAFSGFVRYGLRDWLTAGANLQASRGQWMAGLEAAMATPIGSFAALASASRHEGRPGHALLLGYEGSAKRVGFFLRPQLNLEVQQTSRDFSPLTLLPQLNRYRLTAQGRLSSQLPAQFGIGLSFARFIGRDAEPSQSRYAATLSRRLGSFNLTASYERVMTRGPERAERFLLTLNRQLGRNASLRAAFDTRDHLATAEYSRFLRDEVDSLGGRVALARGDSGISASGEVAYNNNRFAALFSHSVITDSQLGSIRDQESALSLSTQIAIAGGHVAVGRPVGPRFAIVSAHETLGGARVGVEQGSGREHPQAETGAFGPALAPAGNAYTPSDLRFSVDKLPDGYDIGNSQYTVIAPAAAGYHVLVGSDASHMLLGTAVDPAGTPVSLQGGTLRSLDDPKFEPVLVFTNRAGRFAGNGLKPGRYEMLLGEERPMVVTVTVPPRSKGVVDVGQVTMHEQEKKP